MDLGTMVLNEVQGSGGKLVPHLDLREKTASRRPMRLISTSEMGTWSGYLSRLLAEDEWPFILVDKLFLDSPT